MTDDDRFERVLAAVVRESAPELAPPALRQRVEASMRLAATRQRVRRAPLLAAAAAAIVLLVVAAFGGPWLGSHPHATQPGASSPTYGGFHSPVIPTQPSPTAPLLAEPITDPGEVQIGDLLTANDGWVYNTDGRFFLTRSAGAAWRDVTPPGLDPDQPLLPSFFDPQHGWVAQLDRAGGHDLRIWRTTDAGQTWEETVVAGAELVEGGLAFLDRSNGYLTTDPGGQHPKPELRWTNDGGATWSEPIDLATATGIPTLQVVDFFDQQSGVMTGDRTLLRTNDGGRTWIDAQPSDTRSSPWAPRYGPVHIVNASTAFVVVEWLDDTGKERRRTVIESQDAGASWTMAEVDGLHREWGFISALNWIGTDGVKVWMTSDDGATFNVGPSTGLPVLLDHAYLDFVDPLHGWAEATGGVPCKGFGCLRLFQLFKTDDGGRSWSLVGACEPSNTLAFACPSPRPS